MERTQISLTRQERRILDAISARTGRSVASLIRDAVDEVYGDEASVDDALAAMRQSFGAWKDRDVDTAAMVGQLRSGRRIEDAR